MDFDLKDERWRRSGPVQQQRGDVFAVPQYASSFHCQVEDWHDSEELNRSQWIRRVVKRSNAQSGVLRPTSIDA